MHQNIIIVQLVTLHKSVEQNNKLQGGNRHVICWESMTEKNGFKFALKNRNLAV